MASGPLFCSFLGDRRGGGGGFSNYKHGAYHYHDSIFTWFLIPFIVIVQVIGYSCNYLSNSPCWYSTCWDPSLAAVSSIYHHKVLFFISFAFPIPFTNTHTSIILCHQWVYKQRERPYGLWYCSMDELLFGIYTYLFICIC